MVLTTFNGQPAVKCDSLRETERVLAAMALRGYATRVKIIKAKPGRFGRHFLVFAFPTAELAAT